MRSPMNFADHNPLRQTTAEFVTHHYRERNHQGLANELIDDVRQRSSVGGIRRHKRLGGLLNYCYRGTMDRVGDVDRSA